MVRSEVTKRMGIVAAAIAVSISLTACSSPFVKAKGTQLVCDGRPFIVRGAALMDDATLWYATKTTPNEDGIEERDWAFTALGGINTARLVMKTDYFVDERGAPRNAGFAFLDRQIALAKKYSLRVLLDMHIPSGGATQDFRETEENRRFWTDATLQDIFVERWQRIASRYSEETQIMGFELMNEPTASKETYCALMERVVNAIRAVDRNHLIVLQPIATVEVCDPTVSNMAYAFHFYTPMGFTHQGVPWVPSLSGVSNVSYPGKATDETGEARFFNLAALAIPIQNFADIARKYRVPAIVGEFGVSTAADEESTRTWITDVVNLIEENGLAGYIYWREIGRGATEPTKTGKATMAILTDGGYFSHAQFFGIRPQFAKESPGFDAAKFYRTFNIGEVK